jgi:predicted small metal-binding protein
MALVLECGSIFPGCRFVVHAEDEDELLVKLAEHARATHEFERLSEPLKERVRNAIRAQA